MKNTRIIPLADGPITVAIKQEGPYWIATALEFDIIGTGRSRQDAIDQLQELVSLYLFEVVQDPEKHNIFNPSDSAAWNLEDKVKYNVLITLTVNRKQAAQRQRITLNDVRPIRKDIREFNLSPACYI